MTAADSASAVSFRSSDRSSGVSLTDAEWTRIEPLLPDRTPKRSGRRRDHREVIDAIVFKFQTGVQRVTCRRGTATGKGLHPVARVRRGRRLGAGLHCADGSGRRRRSPDWAVSVDSTIVGAHQHLAGARKKGPRPKTRRPRHRPTPRRTDHEDPPRRRRPLRPLAFVLTAGQAGDTPVLTDAMSRLRAPRQQGRLRTRPDMILADKAYSSGAIRDHLHQRDCVEAGRAQATCLRPLGVQAAQHRRTVRQPAQAMARHRHSP
ncbi:transposase [Streptomyces sp. NPDC058175]|uniref:transposase n=1 Tax=Streptomyces sp. NPDC058175 TaxID=3346367 RepID=UPI0036F13519